MFDRSRSRKNRLANGATNNNNDVAESNNDTEIQHQQQNGTGHFKGNKKSNSCKKATRVILAILLLCAFVMCSFMFATFHHYLSITTRTIFGTQHSTFATLAPEYKENAKGPYQRSLPIFEPPDDLIVTGALKEYKPVPEELHKTYCLGPSRFVAAEYAFKEHGWTRINKHNCETKAQIVYYGKGGSANYKQLYAWQRFSRVANSNAWEHKNDFLSGLRSFATEIKELQADDRTINEILYFLPETYLLYDETDRKEFENRLYHQNGMDHNWVLKHPKLNNGKGIEILGANSPALKRVLTRTDRNDTANSLQHSMKDLFNKNDEQANNKNNDTNTTQPIDYLIQSYICNELVWFGGQKFDLRFYWLVASVDPPIVLFHDGYARVSKLEYQETNFSSAALHLTNHNYRDDANDENVLADNLWDLVTQHYAANKKELQSKLPPTVQGDPVMHVRNQIKEAIGMFSAAFLKPVNGNPIKRQFQNPHAEIVRKKVTAQNFFAFYGCDFIVDNDLDVYFIEAQAAPGFGVSKPWRRKMFENMFYPMPLLVDEIQTKQTVNPRGNLLPIENLASWEIVRAGDWIFQYHGYQRQVETKKKCEG